MRIALIGALTVLLMMAWGPVPAGQSKRCQAIMAQLGNRYGGDPKYKKDWGFMNHYCSCVEKYYALLRAKTRYQRSYLLGEVKDGCGYGLKFTSPGFPARAAIHLQLAKAYKAYRDYPRALKEYRQALKLDPFLVYAYTGISDVYRHQRDYRRALAAIEEGLRHVPRSRALRKRKKRLEKRLAKASAGD